jgi:hypothetical protein
MVCLKVRLSTENDKINGLFEGSPLNTAPQVWTTIKKIGKGKQPSCVGCRSSKILKNLHPHEQFVYTTKLQLLAA